MKIEGCISNLIENYSFDDAKFLIGKPIIDGKRSQIGIICNVHPLLDKWYGEVSDSDFSIPDSDSHFSFEISSSEENARKKPTNLRLCKVADEIGYFHGWENYSKPLEASPFIGGPPAGVFSQTMGLVEFEDGFVKRINPWEIKFCDEINSSLSVFNKKEK